MNELNEMQAAINKKEKRNDAGIEKFREKILQEVLQPAELSFAQLEKYALEIIKAYGVISLAAERLGIQEITLRKHLANNAELAMIRQHSLSGFKGLVDKEMVKAIESGDKDMLALAFRHFYAGRDKGALNFNEFGSLGEEDEHFAGKDKVSKQGIHVHIHFTDDDAKRASDFNVVDIEQYIDIEPETED